MAREEREDGKIARASQGAVDLDPSGIRKSVIRALVPQGCRTLLDVGCGPLTPRYAYADLAETIVANDWNLRVHGDLPHHIRPVEGDFTKLDLGVDGFDTIIAADVFEHVALEDEARFAARCTELLRPGAHLIVSVPHAGRYAWLDPYQMKPCYHGLLHRLGLRRETHNGTCDIRKGHKHYSPNELEAAFPQLERVDIRRWGRLFEPLAAWSYSLGSRGVPVPGARAVAQGLAREGTTDMGDDAYSMAILFRRPRSGHRQ